MPGTSMKEEGGSRHTMPRSVLWTHRSSSVHSTMGILQNDGKSQMYQKILYEIFNGSTLYDSKIFGTSSAFNYAVFWIGQRSLEFHLEFRLFLIENKYFV